MEAQKQSGHYTEKNILMIDSNTEYGSICTAEFGKKGYKVTAIAVKKETDPVKKLKELWEQEGGFYGVVITVPGWKEGAFLKLDEDELEEAYGLLFRMPLCLLQTAALLGSADGRLKSIVFLSNVDGIRASKTDFLAGSLHASLHRAAQSFALQLAPKEIRLNVIAAGMTEKLVTSGMAEAGLGKRLPFGRLGSAAEAAGLAEVLMQDGTAWVTGNIWTADGGYSLAGMPENDFGYGWDVHKNE